jgi:tetratricopeptide (TPR) repeat protein
MIGAPTGEGFVGSSQEAGFVGTALPPSEPQAPLGERQAAEAIGTGSQARPIGSSGVTDSVAYGRQPSAGARKSETSRVSELHAVERVNYPVQSQHHLAEGPSAPLQEGLEPAQQAQGQLQPAISLGGGVNGAAPEGIQVRRDTAVFRLRLGHSLFERRDAASAREEFLSAISLDPTLSPPHYYLGRIAQERGDRELAVKWYESYLGRAPGGEHTDEVRDRLKQLGN